MPALWRGWGTIGLRCLLGHPKEWYGLQEANFGWEVIFPCFVTHNPFTAYDIDGFFLDKTEVTNEQFERFVQATGYVTVAERIPSPEDFPGAPPENLIAGSVVFTAPSGPVPLDDHFRWWSYIRGADWRHPQGAGSTIEGKMNYPVVHVALRGCARLRGMDRQTPSDRSGMGVCRTRRFGQKILCLGR